MRGCAAGSANEQPALLQFSVTNTVLANGVGNSGANLTPHAPPVSAPAAGPSMGPHLPSLGGLPLPSLAGVAGPGAGAALLISWQGCL